MTQSWKNLMPIGYLALANPPEALGVYLLQHCDNWRIAELDIRNSRTPQHAFQDILEDVKGLVYKLLCCVELECVTVGRCHGMVLDELDRANYRVEYIPSTTYPNKAIFYVMFEDDIIMSDVVMLPPHLIHH